MTALRTSRPLTVLHVPDLGPELACTLELAEQGERLAEWSDVVAGARSVQRVDGGVRLELPDAADLRSIADLVVREQACCAFLSFAVRTGPEGASLEVTGPPEARPIIEDLLATTR